jgi:hypothetical protein
MFNGARRGGHWWSPARADCAADVTSDLPHGDGYLVRGAHRDSLCLAPQPSRGTVQIETVVARSASASGR